MPAERGMHKHTADGELPRGETHKSCLMSWGGLSEPKELQGAHDATRNNATASPGVSLSLCVCVSHRLCLS